MPHFLKSLELNGFKSFAQKTVLHFPDGITAIVGPNGSGKSNIVDAFRWILGEREAKNLRGAKVEDLIFAGTPEKSRQGLAQASLNFENKGGFFPVDMSEISVMRQVSRDGQSQYFMNQSEVRLKDLIDFFAKVRLGTKGLTIVTQGNSDLFIRATPAERREMLEEMLGLREFQIKKNRAENQLKNTQTNLEKVKALIDEILPHLKSLRRQTVRWQKRGALEEELANCENLLFGSEWKWIEKEIAKVQKEINNHKGELALLETEKSKAEKHQQEVETKEPKEREELEKIKSQTNQLLEKQILLEKDFGRLEVQLEINNHEIPSSLPSAEKLLNLLQRIKSNLESNIEKNLDDLKNIIRNLLREIENEINLSGPQKNSSLAQNLKDKFQKIEADLTSIKKEISTLREKEKILGKSQGEFYAAFKEAVTLVERAKGKIEEWGERNQKIIFERERLELRKDELKRQIVQAGRKPEEFQEKPELKEVVNLEKGLDSSELRELDHRILKIRGDLASIGEIDEAVMKEAKETEDRYEFLGKELEDTEKAKNDLRQLIKDLSDKIKTEFNEALHHINREFSEFFKSMFGGGHAKLVFEKKEKKIVADTTTDSVPQTEGGAYPEEEKAEEGIEINLSLPQKRLTSLEVLSGGERSLVGIAALFAMISVSPPPFLVLDEIDAALDERNTRRFAEMLKTFSKKTQFIIITHNRSSMEAANVLYGVTLDSDGTSKILSLKLEPAS
ncbi:MAG: AAA family ATPase [Patescibacteria group bacterium]